MKSVKNNLIASFNVRQLQFYAAICLWFFCSKNRIVHKKIDNAISYFLSIMLSENLVEWDQSAVALEIIGRYHDLPSDFLSTVPSHLREPLVDLVDNCSEVGWVDMYGRDSGEPYAHLLRCIEILQSHNIEVPDSSHLEILSSESIEHWGQNVDISKVRAVLQKYEIKGLI